MKKIILFAIILAAGFYMAWPAYSLYQIADGVKVKDESKLQNKIAWQSVRSSLREPVTKRVKKEIGNQTKSQGIEVRKQNLAKEKEETQNQIHSNQSIFQERESGYQTRIDE